MGLRLRVVLLYPAVLVISVIMYVIRIDSYVFRRYLDRFEDMLDECYPEGTVPAALVSVIAGRLFTLWFGNSLPPRYEMNFAGFVQMASIFFLVALGLCLFAAIGALFTYCQDGYYQPTNDMLDLWSLFFCGSIMIDSFALGYFIVPALI